MSNKNKPWTIEEKCELIENFRYFQQNKEEAEREFGRSWSAIQTKASSIMITNYAESKNSSMYLGCHVAERILSHVFENVRRMHIHNSGYDFVCSKGYKIDVKSSCLNMNLNWNHYYFRIARNKIADYFLLIAFDNREDLNPKRVWLIKSDEIIRGRKLNDFSTLGISDISSSKFEKYEQSDKLEKTIACCNSLKQ